MIGMEGRTSLSRKLDRLEALAHRVYQEGIVPAAALPTFSTSLGSIASCCGFFFTRCTMAPNDMRLSWKRSA